MIRELREHGYEVSPGTLYPILQGLQTEGLLVKEVRTVNGKNRKYYSITKQGLEVLHAAKEKIDELVSEVKL
jgi:DNA-binding PadR family transcriptional regulator